MSTAHRPTWNPARGADAGSAARFGAPRTAVSASALPRYKTMKHRQPGSVEPLSAEELKRKLEERERNPSAGAAGETPRIDAHPSAEQILDFSALDDAFVAGSALTALVDPADADDVALVQRGASRGASRGSAEPGDGADADVDAGFARGSREGARGGTTAAREDEEGADEEEDDEEDEEDETAELMRELERIKRERAAEAARAAAESDEIAHAEREEAILHGNPLVQAPGAGTASFTVKRRWDDDVIFRNQARKPEKKETTFVNDTLRTEFHRRFLNKYVK